jgi:hypothetical protein
MAQATLNRVLEEIKTLEPDELRLVERAVQSQLEPPNKEPSSVEPSAWEVLEELIGAVSAPPDWSEEHDHYLSGTPRHSTREST